MCLVNLVSEKRESHCRFPGILKFPISGEQNYRLQASHVEAFEVLVSLEVQPVQIVEFGYDHGIFDVIVSSIKFPRILEPVEAGQILDSFGFDVDYFDRLCFFGR